MPVWLCFEAHATDGKVWSLRDKAGKWQGPYAVVKGPGWQTVYRGPDAPQPKAYLKFEDGTAFVVESAIEGDS